jgi:competence protein ComEA
MIPRLSNLLLRNAVLCAASLAIAATAGAQTNKKPVPNIPDGKGKDAVIKVCGNCHGVEVAVSRRETKEGWNGVVDDMIQRGAQGTDDEFGDIVEYLSSHYSKSAPGGKVNVNSATVSELTGGAGFTDAQATAIVQYRTEKGKFGSIADLAKVPGIDGADLDAKKSKLAF